MSHLHSETSSLNFSFDVKNWNFSEDDDDDIDDDDEEEESDEEENHPIKVNLW